MATRVIMPKAGMAMEEGILVNWLKKVGDEVRAGEPIAEIETDKAVMELEAELDGTLIAIVSKAGDRVPVTETMAWIGARGERPPEAEISVASGRDGNGDEARPVPPKAAPAFAPSEAGVRIAATPAARRLAVEAGIDVAAVRRADGRPLHVGDVRRHISETITPLASRMAEAAGIDPATLRGVAEGRVRKVDVIAAVEERRRAAEAEATAGGVGPPAAMGKDIRLPLTGVQRVTGQRLARSSLEIPSVTLFAVADVTALLEARQRINASGTIKVSLNDLALRACAKALAANPRVNAVLDGDALVLKGRINIGFAVATEAGLQVPVIRDADRLSLPEQASTSRDLAERARSRRLRPEESEGGTFTVSNVGMYGITAFTPIINQPQVGILGVGMVEDRLALGEGRIPVEKKALYLSFSFDHRAMDGVESSRFLSSVRTFLESPLLLVM